jgi:hypothetical protein
MIIDTSKQINGQRNLGLNMTNTIVIKGKLN